MVGYLGEVLDVRCISSEARGCELAIATNTDNVTVFNEYTGHCDLLSGHVGVVLSLDSSSDGQFVLSASKVIVVILSL